MVYVDDMTFLGAGHAFVVSGHRALGVCMASQAPLVPRVFSVRGSLELGAQKSMLSPLAAASCQGLVGPLHPWPGLATRTASGTDFDARFPAQCYRPAQGSPDSHPLPSFPDFASPRLFSVCFDFRLFLFLVCIQFLVLLLCSSLLSTQHSACVSPHEHPLVIQETCISGSKTCLMWVCEPSHVFYRLCPMFVCFGVSHIRAICIFFIFSARILFVQVAS